MVDNDYTKIGARFRRCRIGYTRWMGLITVQVNSLQAKASMGSKEPSSNKRRRGKRGSRDGKARARRQTSLQPEISGPAPKHSNPLGMTKRYSARHYRLIEHAYLFFSRWYEMKKRILRKELVPTPKVVSRGLAGEPLVVLHQKSLPTAKRANDLHDLGVQLIKKGNFARKQVDAIRGKLSIEEFLLRKNIEWYNWNIREDTDEAPQLVAVNKPIIRPPSAGSGPGVLPLECPKCGTRRVSVLSKCKCGYTPTRNKILTRPKMENRSLANMSGRPGGSKAPKSTRRN
jgi:hypothetical protein